MVLLPTVMLAALSHSAPPPDATTVVAVTPPTVLVENVCRYTNQNPAYGALDLLVAFRLQNFVDHKPAQVSATETVVFNLSCGMGYGALVDSRYVCHGATLRLDNLVSGGSITRTSLAPLAKDWNMVEFRVAERTGSLFRLASAVRDPSGLGEVQATIIADFATGRVTYTKHQTMSGRTWASRGEAMCKVDGWAANGPVKAYWE